PIGKSLAEHDLVGEARASIDLMAKRSAEVPIPTDVGCARELSADAKPEVKAVADGGPDDMIRDIGTRTAEAPAAKLREAGTIVWSGPVGVFECPAFAGGTEAIARAIAQSGAYSIAGGGDTRAAISKFGVADGIDYISTGG